MRGEEAQGGNTSSGELPSEGRALGIVQRCPPLSDTSHDGVPPETPAIGVEGAIDLLVGLLDTCIRPAGEREAKRTSRCPAQAKLPTPQELLGEGRWYATARVVGADTA